jgi:hypothetical protein
MCSHSFKLSYMFEDGSTRCSCSSVVFPSSASRTRDFRGTIERLRGLEKRKDNKMFYDYVPAGDFSVMQKLINHTSVCFRFLYLKILRREWREKVDMKKVFFFQIIAYMFQGIVFNKLHNNLKFFSIGQNILSKNVNIEIKQ